MMHAIVLIERRAQEARFAVDSNISDFDVIQSALLPVYPEKSYRKIIAIVLGIFGFIATILYIAVKLLLKKELVDLGMLTSMKPAVSCFLLPSETDLDNRRSNYLDNHQNHLRLLSQVDSWTRNTEKISISVQSFHASLTAAIQTLLSKLYHHKQVQVVLSLSHQQDGLALDVNKATKDLSKQQHLSSI